MLSYYKDTCYRREMGSNDEKGMDWYKRDIGHGVGVGGSGICNYSFHLAG